MVCIDGYFLTHTVHWKYPVQDVDRYLPHTSHMPLDTENPMSIGITDPDYYGSCYAIEAPWKIKRSHGSSNQSLLKYLAENMILLKNTNVTMPKL